MNFLAKKLKELREEKGFSQYKLSEELNIKRSAYGNYETGLSYPEYNVLEKIADYYKVDVRELLGSSEELEKKLNLKEEKNNVERAIKEYYYKKYRVVPSDKILNNK